MFASYTSAYMIEKVPAWLDDARDLFKTRHKCRLRSNRRRKKNSKGPRKVKRKMARQSRKMNR